MKRMTLKEVCNYVGVTRRAVQGYEKARLVTSIGKNKYGYLLYDDTGIEKIKMVKQYQGFGFSVKEIKKLLAVTESEYVDLLERQLLKMRVDLQKMQANIEVLEQMIFANRKGENL